MAKYMTNNPRVMCMYRCACNNNPGCVFSNERDEVIEVYCEGGMWQHLQQCCKCKTPVLSVARLVRYTDDNEEEVYFCGEHTPKVIPEGYEMQRKTTVEGSMSRCAVERGGDWRVLE